MPGDTPDLNGPRLDSAQVAARLGVTVGTVYKLRAARQGFPNPVGYSGRSPLYAASAIEEYVVARSLRSPSDRGRRPRVVAAGTVDTGVFAERLRDRIKSGAGRSSVRSQADLIARLGLNIATFGERMRGRTRWKESELQLIADVLDMDVTDANDFVNRGRTAVGS